MKLTLPSRDDPGSCLIAVDGQVVGHCLAGYWDWKAYLWPVPERWDPLAPTVTKCLLRELRAELQRRLDETGPWWK